MEIVKLQEVRHMVTKGCNLKCYHCYMNGGDKMNEPDISFTEDQILDFYSKYKPEIVSATGGEPLLKKKLIRIIAKAINPYGGKLEIVTNGMLLEAEFLKEIMSLNPGSFFQISLDGNKDFHNSIRKNEEAYDGAIKAIRLISDSSIPLKVRMTVTNKNMNQVKDVIDLLDSFNNPNIKLVMRPIILAGRAKNPRVSELIGSGVSNEELAQFNDVGKSISIETTDNMGKCGCGVNTIAIDNRGYIYPCNYFTENENYRMGHVFKAGESISEHPAFKKFGGESCFARHLLDTNKSLDG